MSTTTLRPPAQHAWESSLRRDEAGRVLPARFHRLLLANVIGEATPADAVRFEDALREIEDRYEFGPDGLLTCVGWGVRWISEASTVSDPFGPPLPMSRWEEPEIEDVDVCIHLASDDEERLASIADELFGDGPLDQSERLRLVAVRTGFVGPGLPAERLPQFDIPKGSPLLLGFRSGLRNNQAPEERITIRGGPFSGGTTMHVSRIVLDLEAWYAQPHEQRTALMYAPTVTPDEADGFVDDALSDADRLPEVVREHGIVGHAQASARARVGNVPKINRRDFATLDDDLPGTHFVSLQRERGDFLSTRAIMNASDAPDHSPRVGPRRGNGIHAFMEVLSRSHYVVPPRSLRAYPYLPGKEES